MKQFLKFKLALFFWILSTLFAFTVAWKAVEQPPKSYTVTLSLDQWQNILTQVDSTRKILLDSDVPTRKTVYATSALSLITQTISMQVSQQLAAEQKAAADTTKVKNPKK